MWVWIPRYAYQIATNYHLSTAGTINIRFLRGLSKIAADGSTVVSTATYSGSSQTNFIEHPGFNFGNHKVSGIWVAKFEATATEGVANGFVADWSCPTAGDNVTTKTVRIVPNVASWRCINVGNMFAVSRNMETNAVYGWGTSGAGIDTHLMKNVEWGAVAYLSKSNRGKDAIEVWINPNQNYTTGCAGTSASAAATTACELHHTTNGVQASTNGNITGVYDMSGSAWEYVAAYVNNGHGNLLGQGSQIINADPRYRDIYTMGTPDNSTNNYNLTIDIKGDVIWETSSNTEGNFAWFGDAVWTPNTGSPWFVRGGSFGNGSTAGAFAFTFWGGTNSIIGFRPVLVVSSGL